LKAKNLRTGASRRAPGGGRLKLRSLLLPLALAVVCGLGGCTQRYPAFRYRLTMTFDVDGVLRTGSSVVQITPGVSYGLEGQGGAYITRGEAAAVDLGDGRYVFGLLSGAQFDPDRLRGPHPVWWANAALGPIQRLYSISGGSDSLGALHSLTGIKDVPHDTLPALVTFKDNNDPSTIELLNPDDLADVLGPNVKLVRATLEMGVNKPVTEGLTQILPWLSLDRNYIDGNDSCVPPNCWQKNQFIAGVKR